jgi:glycosyltransferase involved in cell wall biosynthesis
VGGGDGVTGPDAPRTTPVVSVVMTTYRTPSPLLASSIRSVLTQTIAELELVLVLDSDADDPDDQAGSVLDDLADPRVTIIRPGRIGRGRALNVGREEARADLIAVQDADDESHPERLERQVAALARHREVGLLATGVRRTADLEAHARWLLPDPSSPSRVGDRILATNPLVHSSVIARRAALEAVAGYSVSRQWQLDYDLYLRLRGNGVVLSTLSEPLVLKRLHADQYFENSPAPLDRLWSAYRLQLAHARSERVLRRYAYGALASGRFATRGVRQLVRTRRPTPARG